ncbi:MAG TPA: fumarylacetoacetate hydrolase family protein, partial [Gaiellales bacterium]|nr:fumarylacetoacetate hydrolase family protein [Gaiellales bacterium]
MKAVRYAGDGGARLGRLDDGQVVDAGPAPPEGFVPSEAAWETIEAASGPATAIDGVRLLHPTMPAKIIAIGLNYRDHAEESDLEIPPVPVIFAKYPSALIGHGEPIVVPREENRPDYEGEVAAILGRTVYRATADEA